MMQQQTNNESIIPDAVPPSLHPVFLSGIAPKEQDVGRISKSVR